MIMARGGVPLLIRSGRNPFEVLMLSACVASGVVGLAEPQSASGVITAALPHWESVCWYGGLAAGGVVGIIGVFSRGVTSLLIERVGIVMLTFLTLAYSMAIITQVGLRGALPALFTGLFAIACAVRFVYITTDLKRLEDIATKPLDGDE
jgi:hypothetical protein